MTDFAKLYREATERGMRDFERGVPRDANPFEPDYATEQPERWREGWDNAQELARQDATRSKP